MKKIYRINGELIKSPPNGIEIEKYNLTKATRTADGKMKMELITKKLKFILKYPVISTSEVQQLEKLIFSNELFFTFEYPEDGVTKTATVYTGPIKKIPAWNDWVWYWKDYELHFIEQ